MARKRKNNEINLNCDEILVSNIKIKLNSDQSITPISNEHIIPLSDEKLDKLQQSKIKNRKSAALSREREKQKLNNALATIKKLENDISKLELQKNELVAELYKLKIINLTNEETLNASIKLFNKAQQIINVFKENPNFTEIANNIIKEINIFISTNNTTETEKKNDIILDNHDDVLSTDILSTDIISSDILPFSLPILNEENKENEEYDEINSHERSCDIDVSLFFSS